MEHRSMKKNLLTFFITLFASLFLFSSTTAQASYIPTGASLAYGSGKPNGLTGYRGALQWDWGHTWFASSPLNLTGYWDASLAYWNTHGDAQGNYKSITAFALAPVFHLQTRDSILGNTKLAPFIEGSIGLSALSRNRLANRSLGGSWAFQDILGVGLAFGSHYQYSLSYNYLHYSNAHLASQNAGIDVKSLIKLSYRF